MNLFIIESDQTTRRLIADLLTVLISSGGTVEWSASYAEGLKRLLESKPDLCLLGDWVDGEHGAQALRTMIAAGCQVPLVVLAHQVDSDLGGVWTGASDVLLASELTLTDLRRVLRYGALHRDYKRALQLQQEEVELRLQLQTAELSEAKLQLKLALNAGHKRLLDVETDTTPLEYAEDNLRLLADSVPQLAWMAHADGNIFWYNKKWYDYTGTTLEQMAGWGWQSVHDPAVLPQVLEGWGAAIHSGRQFAMEFPLRRADGAFRWFLTRVNPVKNQAGEVIRWFGTNTDIDEHKHLECSLKAATEKAEAANAAKSEFLANMSHEIRTPLGAVLGFAELIIQPGLAAEQRHEYLGAIQRNGELLSNIINDILDLSKVEAGKLEMDLHEVALEEVVGDVKSLVGRQAQEKGIDLRIKYEGNLPKAIRTDSLRLRQILLNVVGNAVKFTKVGSVDVKIMPVVEPDGAVKIAFEVSDTGVGLTKEQAANLFQLFTQADMSTKRIYGGTGLGLVLSRRLAEALGGTVTLTNSSHGVGSTFTATVALQDVRKRPKAPSESLPRRKKASPSVFPQVDLGGAQILVIDDAPDNRMLVSSFLKLAGATVATADNGLEGMQMAATLAYDVVLMDLQMPVMDGFEATAKLRASGFKAPIIALTAHAMQGEKQNCLRRGFDDYLSKPVSRRLLVEKIAYFTQTRRAPA